MSLLLMFPVRSPRIRPRPFGVILAFHGQAFTRKNGPWRRVTREDVGDGLSAGEELKVGARSRLTFFLHGHCLTWSTPDVVYPVPRLYSKSPENIAFERATDIAGRTKGPLHPRLRYPTEGCAVRGSTFRIDPGGWRVATVSLTGTRIGTVGLPIRDGVPLVDAVAAAVTRSVGTTLTLAVTFERGDQDEFSFGVLTPKEEADIHREVSAYASCSPLLRHLAGGKIYLDAGLYREAVAELSNALRIAPESRKVRNEYSQALRGAGEEGIAESTGHRSTPASRGQRSARSRFRG